MTDFKHKDANEFEWTDELVKELVEKAWFIGITQEKITPMQVVKDFKAKIKNPPLFKTLDSCEIFEGDNYYKVEDWRIVELIASSHGVRSNADLCFKRIENAKDFVINNKPHLSVSDLNYISYINKTAYDDIVRISRQKIKRLYPQ